jgi:agmatine deiminase
VTIAASPQNYALLRERAGENIDVVSIPLDDCWARDISPLFVVAGDVVVAKSFGFNSWGAKFEPAENDRNFGVAIARQLNMSVKTFDLVLEGGSVSTDGEGTAIIVEPTVLNENRNPGVTKREVEEILARSLGLGSIIWLPFGLLGDVDTDGHVDNVAVFCGAGRVLVQASPSSTHPDAERLKQNLRVLSKARDSSGRSLELVEVPWLPTSPFDDSRPSSYVNSYPGNEAVYVPVVGETTDDAALELVGQAFGKREPVAAKSSALSFGGGGPHCMTMQIPVLRKEKESQ